MCSLFTVALTCTVYVHTVPNTPVGLKAAPGSWDRWPVLASLPLLRAAEADQESERAQRQVASGRQGVCRASAGAMCGCGYAYVHSHFCGDLVRGVCVLLALCSGRVCMTCMHDVYA